MYNNANYDKNGITTIKATRKKEEKKNNDRIVITNRQTKSDKK